MGIMNKSEDLKGSLFIFLSALMYATMPILGKLAFRVGLTPGGALLLRYLFSFILLTLLIRFIIHERVLTMSPIVIVQGTCLTIGSLLYFYSLKYLTAGIATVIFYIYPVLVACLAIPVYKEKLGYKILGALLLAVAGVFLVSGLGMETQQISSTGVFLALGSCICYSFYSLIGQKTVAQTNPLSITATMSLAAIIILASFSNQDLVFLGALNWQQILVGLAMAIANTLLAIWFFLKGVQKIGASRAALISTVEPPLCILLAFIILGETLTLWQLLGSLLVLAGMILAIKPGNPAASQP